jgi:hypothetical protein
VVHHFLPVEAPQLASHLRFVSIARCLTSTDHQRLTPGAQERLQRGEWGAVALSALGTIGIGATSEDAPAAAPGTPSAARIISVLALLCAAVLALSLVRTRRPPGRAAAGKASKSVASIYGLQVGPRRILNSLEPPSLRTYFDENGRQIGIVQHVLLC